MMGRCSLRYHAESANVSSERHLKKVLTSAVLPGGGPGGGAAWVSCTVARSRVAGFDVPFVMPGRLDTLAGAG